jgi:DNA segregation ATPase FtsK/SpoIIIE-like protein
MYDDELKELEPLYPQAVEFAKSEASMSISKLQRKFQIGYNRAARMIERLAADGVLTFNNMTGAYSRSSGKTGS